MGLALSLAAAVIAGLSIITLLRPPLGTRRLGLLLASAIGFGCGLGITSLTWFLWLLLFGAPGRGYVMAEVASLAGLAVGCIVARRRLGGSGSVSALGPGISPTLRRALTACLALVVVSSVIGFVVEWRARPHGDLDAYAIWNLRARFLYRGGEHWQDVGSPALDWTHADYPLLLPASVARAWTYLGHESTLAPGLLALLFLLATAGALGAMTAALRGPVQGMLAGLVLLGSFHFLEVGYWQVADIPLAFFMLAAVGLLALKDHAGVGGGGALVLAGMMAGFAAWTKNEGLLFLACLVSARLAVRGRAGGWKGALRELPALMMGALPAALVLAYYKLRLVPTNDLVAGQGAAATWSRLTDAARYLVIGRWFGEVFLNTLGPAAVALALGFVLLGRAPLAARRAAALPLLVVSLMLAGYVVVYLTTPRELVWHLITSLHRLYLHIWPVALLGYFLCVATPEEAAARVGRPSQ